MLIIHNLFDCPYTVTPKIDIHTYEKKMALDANFYLIEPMCIDENPYIIGIQVYCLMKVFLTHHHVPCLPH